MSPRYVRMVTWISCVIILSGAAACGGARAPAGATQGATGPDRVFLTRMAPVLEAGARAATQVTGRSTRAELLQFAERVRADHARWAAELRTIADSLFAGAHEHEGAPEPAVRDIPAGPAFDREWIWYIVGLQQQAIDIANERLEKRGEVRVDSLARAIMQAEKSEQVVLRTWARQWFGASP